MPDTVGWLQRDAGPAWASGVSSLAAMASSRPDPGRALVLAADAADALWLAGRGWQVTTVSADAVAASRLSAQAALQAAPLEALAEDPLSYRPPPAAFSLIVVSYLELAWSQLRRLLARLVPGLATGGHLIVVGVDARNLDSGFGGPANPDLLTSAGQVAELLAGLDLGVINSEVVRREVVVDVGVRYALDHLVEAVRSTAE